MIAGYKTAGVWPLALRPFLERCGTFWKTFSAADEKQITDAMPHLIELAHKNDELYDHELLAALNPEWLAAAEEQLGEDAERALLDSRLQFAIVQSTTEGRHGTHILSGVMSTARRQAAKAYKAETKAQKENSSNEKRLARTQRNEQYALIAISEYCKRKDGKSKAWSEVLYTKTMHAALVHLSGYDHKSTLKKVELISLLEPFLAAAAQAAAEPVATIANVEIEEIVPVPVTNTTRSGRATTRNPKFA